MRNVNMGSWEGGVLNMVFVGSVNAPETHCGQEGAWPTTTVGATPIIAEKPYIIANDDQYLLMRPRFEYNKIGITPGF
jgi:hypothetical protein